MRQSASQKGGRAALRTAFNGTTPDAVRRADADPATLEQLAAIHRRTEAVKDKVRAHYDKHVEVWVAKEAYKLWQRRAEHAAVGPLPDQKSNFGREVSANAHMSEARRLVQSRATARLSKVNRISKGLSNAVVRNVQTNTLRASFRKAQSLKSPKLTNGR
jgi:hypothetical protein